MRGFILMGGILAAAMAGGGAMAATVITLDQSVNGQPGRPQVMYLDTDKLRMSSPDNDMIFRGDQSKVWIVRPQDKAYIELTPEGMAQMKAQMDQMQAQMQQQMASMPPEQRKQMEAMMAGRGMGPNAPAAQQITYTKAGEPKKVGDYSCTPFKVTMNAGPTSDFCIASLSDLGLTRDDLKSFVGFGTFMSQMGGTGTQRSPMASLDFDSMKQQIGFDGFPVETAFKAPDGRHNVDTVLKSIQHQAPPAGTFDLPAGFTRQDMGAGMGWPGQGGPGMGHGPRPPG